ncbi:MAG: LexA family transcriptional regulator [Bacteroides sp.]|nr:LexA family transcriptional regulator [Bacteroides sp.]
MEKELVFARFKKAIDYLKDNGKIHKQQDIADAIGISKAYMSDVMRDRGGKFSKDFIHRFSMAYSGYISEEWLLTGNGEMIIPDDSLKPHYDAKASAGFMDGLSEGKMPAEFRAIATPMLNYDFSIDTSGNSMMPRIENGDTLLCKISDDRLNPPLGKICVIDTMDGAVVKEITDVGETSLTLHSLNPDYEDYEIELTSINRIAEVVGLLREF